MIDETTIEVSFGAGFTARTLDDRAIVDIETAGVVCGLEVLSLAWSGRSQGVSVSPPSPRDLGDDSGSVRYHPDIDVLYIEMYPGRPKLLPYASREVPISLLLDYGDRVRGLEVTLHEYEVRLVMQRVGHGS
ncbi:MAG: hypothetical protein AAGG07_00955 [Planctomycetota bacterium]